MQFADVACALKNANCYKVSHKNAQLLQKLSRFISSVHSFFFPFSWERFFTNLLEQRTKDVPYMLFPVYAGVFLIPAECCRPCGAVVHPSAGRPGEAERA